MFVVSVSCCVSLALLLDVVCFLIVFPPYTWGVVCVLVDDGLLLFVGCLVWGCGFPDACVDVAV